MGVLLGSLSALFRCNDLRTVPVERRSVQSCVFNANNHTWSQRIEVSVQYNVIRNIVAVQ